MFNIGFGEFLIIAIILFIVVGPERLPALMKTVGEAIRGVRQASRDLRSSVGLDELMNQNLLDRPPRKPPRPRVTPVEKIKPASIGPEDLKPKSEPERDKPTEDDSPSVPTPTNKTRDVEDEESV